MGWLDLCCGSGRALVQATQALRQGGHRDRVTIVGVDLIDGFTTASIGPELDLVSASVTDWGQPAVDSYYRPDH